MRLSEISTISSGAFLKPAPEPKIIYLLSRDFDSQGDCRTKLFASIPHDHKTDEHLLNDGDILFASKGIANYATVYRSNMGLAIASSTFSIIRLKTLDIIPEYLKWWLNLPQNIAKIRSEAMVTSTPLITIAQLREIKINIPDLATQEKIIKIDALSRQEQQIKQKLLELDRKHITSLLRQKIKNK